MKLVWLSNKKSSSHKSAIFHLIQYMEYTSAEDSGITPEVLLAVHASLSTKAITALTLACELWKTK